MLQLRSSRTIHHERALQLARKLALNLEKPQTVPLSLVLPIPGAVARIALDLHLFDVLAETPDGNTLAGLSDRVGVGGDPVLLRRRPSPHRLAPLLLPVKRARLARRGDEANGPFQYAYNTTLSAFDWWGQDPALSAKFNTFMTRTAAATRKPRRVNWFPVQKEHRLDEARRDKDAVLLVDVGGRRSHDIVTFLTKFPHAPGRAVLQNLPSKIEDYRLDNVWGKRIEPVKYSFFDVQPIQNARICFLHHVLYRRWS